MTVFSSLRSLLRVHPKLKHGVINRSMSEHNTFKIVPSKWQWNKFKDLAHYYILLGVIPCSLAILGANIFIGPATLSEVPEDYVPKHWEYYRSPITRFIARYILPSPQQEHEKFLAYIFMEDEKRRIRKLEAEIKSKIAERNDYQAYYYRPVLAKYHRITKEAADYVESIRGE